jgi:dihydroxyacid dehydratase/phosphogluconate dehydratase
MACMTEALGLQLPGGAAWPAADSRRLRLAQVSGRRAVGLVREGAGINRFLTKASFENAIMVLSAIGGSTNAVVHLLAIAGRAGVELSLDDFDRLGREVPTLVNLKPSGQFLMEDFAYAGGVPAVLAELAPLLRNTPTVSGRDLVDVGAGAVATDRAVITPFSQPMQPPGSGTAVLRGNLCPDGAVIKQSAASPALMVHRGQALVFPSVQAYNAARDDPELPVDESSVLIVQNAGPRGYPGMPEVGNLQLPRKLLVRGVTDMVRISDARMSGTAYGTVVLHVAPEAAIGGPLALARTGDWVSLDVPRRRLELEVGSAELEDRKRRWQPPNGGAPTRGYAQLYVEHVLQADKGADFDFLVGYGGHDIPLESH